MGVVIGVPLDSARQLESRHQFLAAGRAVGQVELQDADAEVEIVQVGIVALPEHVPMTAVEEVAAVEFAVVFVDEFPFGYSCGLGLLPHEGELVLIQRGVAGQEVYELVVGHVICSKSSGFVNAPADAASAER